MTIMSNRRPKNFEIRRRSQAPDETRLTVENLAIVGALGVAAVYSRRVRNA